MVRFSKLSTLVFTSAVVLAGCGGSDEDSGLPHVFTLTEATVADMQLARTTRLLSLERLVGMYLARIAAYDVAGPMLKSFLHVNPKALDEARALDTMPASLGPLHGIAVMLKDNVNTFDMPTTGGSVALAGSMPAHDAFITKKLRAAGAVILGKGQLTEFANFMTDDMPSGYSALGGYALNPYDPRPLPEGDGRQALAPGGSSAGPAVAVAANLTALAIGTETSGSILSPGTANGIVGIKPTVGLVSRDGILPISADQDTAGPMARTVRDAALLLGVIAGHDPADADTTACLTPGNCHTDYTQFLDTDALKGARIVVPPFPTDGADFMEAAIAVIEKAGGTVTRQTVELAEVTVPSILSYGFKRDLNAYLARLPAASSVHSLSEIIAYNASMPTVALKYGQTILVAAEALSLDPASADTATYRANREAGAAMARGILATALDGPDGMAGTADDHDALLFFGKSGADTPARAGWPSVVVPGGFVAATDLVAHPFPAGVTFSGRAFSEPKLIALAYAFEQATHHRRPPASTPALAGDTVTR